MQFDQQIESTVPNGVAPFVVASQTLVTNLNANFLNGFGPGAFAEANHDHTSSQITDSTAAGKAMLTAEDDLAQLALLGLVDSAVDVTLDAIAKVYVRKNSTNPIFARRRLNLIEGAGIQIAIADNPTGQGEVGITITATPSPPSSGPLAMFAWVVARWNGSAWTILNGWNVSGIAAASGSVDYWRVNFVTPASLAPYVCESAYTRNDTASAYRVLPQLFNNLSDTEKAGIVISGFENVFPPQVNDVLFLKFFTT